MPESKQELMKMPESKQELINENAREVNKSLWKCKRRKQEFMKMQEK